MIFRDNTCEKTRLFSLCPRLSHSYRNSKYHQSRYRLYFASKAKYWHGGWFSYDDLTISAIPLGWRMVCLRLWLHSSGPTYEATPWTMVRLWQRNAPFLAKLLSRDGGILHLKLNIGTKPTSWRMVTFRWFYYKYDATWRVVHLRCWSHITWRLVQLWQRKALFLAKSLSRDGWHFASKAKYWHEK
jgi:hypothetical protein